MSIFSLTCRAFRSSLSRLKNSKALMFSRPLGSGTLPKTITKVGLCGITLGVLVGTGYSIHKLNQPRLHIINEEITAGLIDELPKIVPSREVHYVNDGIDLHLTLYQYQTCPFCCKVRAFLDYYGISYDVVEVNPVLRQQLNWSLYKKVPILMVRLPEGYQLLNDSSMIISALSTFLRDEKDLREIVKCYPSISYIDEEGSRKCDIMNKYFLVMERASELKELSEERKWRKWVDDVFVHILSPNVYRTRKEALDAFEWFSNEGDWNKIFPSWERYLIIYVGAAAMYLIGKRLKKKYNLKDDVRESLYDECNFWMEGIEAKGMEFMGGSGPNLADLAMYGVLSSIEGCQAFGDTLSHTSIADWYYSMKTLVSRHEGRKCIY